jgi:hypothetical protein
MRRQSNGEAAGHDRDRIVMGYVDRASPLLLKFTRVARPTGRLLALYRWLRRRTAFGVFAAVAAGPRPDELGQMTK